MKLIAFHNFHFSTDGFLDAVSKGFSGISSICHNIFHLFVDFFLFWKHPYCSISICHISFCNQESMRKSLCINGNMSFNTRNLLSSIIAFLFRCVSIFNALCVYDEECSLFFSSMALSLLSNQFFLKPLPASFSPLILSWYSRWQSKHTDFPIWENQKVSFSTDIHFWGRTTPHRMHHKDQSFVVV